MQLDSLGYQSDCLEALGFGVGGWGAVVGRRLSRCRVPSSLCSCARGDVKEGC